MCASNSYNAEEKPTSPGGTCDASLTPNNLFLKGCRELVNALYGLGPLITAGYCHYPPPSPISRHLYTVMESSAKLGSQKRVLSFYFLNFIPSGPVEYDNAVRHLACCKKSKVLNRKEYSHCLILCNVTAIFSKEVYRTDFSGCFDREPMADMSRCAVRSSSWCLP